MKTKSNTKTRVRKPKAEKYPAHYLGIALAVVLIAEGLIMGSAQSQDWSSAVSVLNVAPALTVTSADLTMVAQPAIDLVSSVNEFYQEAAIQMTQLLDASNYTDDIGLAYNGVNEFYQQASTQMASLLDLSDSVSFVPQVSGALFEK